MSTPFIKMHGLGNDFVVLDARTDAIDLTVAQRRALCDRHRGVGCDQLIVLEAADDADVTMRIHNPDGGEAEACGNASRCIALLFPGPVVIATAGGPVYADRDADGDGEGDGVSVDMGRPRFDWNVIPLARTMNTDALPLGWGALSSPAAVNVGNPHVVFFVGDADAVPLAKLGPVIERDPVFPQGVNVSVAEPVPGGLRLRVWERGAGLTQACGTAACAAAVAAIRAGHATSPVAVTLPGGPLSIEWAEGGSIRMTGPATRVFDGTIDLDALA